MTRCTARAGERPSRHLPRGASRRLRAMPAPRTRIVAGAREISGRRVRVEIRRARWDRFTAHPFRSDAAAPHMTACIRPLVTAYSIARPAEVVHC